MQRRDGNLTCIPAAEDIFKDISSEDNFTYEIEFGFNHLKISMY